MNEFGFEPAVTTQRKAELACRLGAAQPGAAWLDGGRVSPPFATLRRCTKETGLRGTVGFASTDG